MMNIKYRLVGFSSGESKFIKSVLQNQRGWAGLGYVFKPTTSGSGFYDVVIMLKTNKEIKQEFPRPDLDGLSVSRTWSRPMQIWVNKKNWCKVPSDVAMNITTYRKYILQHEMGHILGYGHDQAPHYPHQKCSVMYQQTRGTKNICIANPWWEK